MHILMVDDDPNILDAMKIMLDQTHKISDASCSSDALRILEEQDIDVLITDVYMAGQNGIELCGMLSKRYPNLITILMTGVADIPTVVEGFKQGAFDFIVKPFDINALLEVTDRAAKEINARRYLNKHQILSHQKPNQDTMLGHIQEQSLLSVKRDAQEIQRLQKLIQCKEQQMMQTVRLASIGQITSEMLHEVKNSLFVAKANAQLIEMEVTDKNPQTSDSIKEEISQCIQALDRIESIMNHTQSHARLQNTRVDQISISSVIESTTEFFSKYMSARAVYVEKNLIESFDKILASKVKIEQILINLFKNSTDAIERTHGDEGGFIRVSTKVNVEDVSIIIEDNGGGMTEEVQNNLFEPYFTTEGHDKGTGLGMTICSEYIKDAGGSIEVNSKLGQGSTFTINFPLKK